MARGRERAARQDRLAPFDGLTRSEQRVLGFLMDGRSAERIAGELVVSMSTVRTHVRSVLAKLGVNSQLGAVAAARSAGWEPEPDALATRRP